MVHLKDLVNYIDYELDIAKIKDRFLNGLCIEGKAEIRNIGLSVDVTMDVIGRAVANNCDIIISHHPFLTGQIDSLKGITAKRIELLMKNGISVYVAHAPIDVHKKFSHSVLLAESLGLYGVSKFAEVDGNHFGVTGNLRRQIPLTNFKEMVDKVLKTDSKLYNFGKEEISSIGIVSGSGGFAIENNETAQVDCFLTGEMKHNSLLLAKDLRMNVILAGHYETETLGMQKLAILLTKKFKTQTFFLHS